MLAIILCVTVIALSAGYEIAPITSNMRTISSAVISSLLPNAGVSEKSSLAWQRLAYICDTFGPRFSGSQSLELALDHIRDTARADGLKVTEERTLIPKWVRGEEYATMLTPRVKKLHMIGLGMSNGTMGKNVTGEVIVFSGYDEMIQNCSKAKGKIILFNTIFTTYGATVPTRSNAALWAFQCNAVAALIRSIGPFSMQVSFTNIPIHCTLFHVFAQNPHTGYSEVGMIAAAAISNEDASQMQRMQDRGQVITVSLYMDNKLYPMVPSRNLLIDLVGTEYPDEIGEYW